MHQLLIRTLILLLSGPSLGHPQVESVPQSSAVAFSSISMQAANAFFQSNPVGETVGELAQILEEEDISDDDSAAVLGPVNAVSSTPSYLAARSFPTPSAPASPFAKVSGQRSLNAYYNSTDGAYNLTIPGCLSGYDILGQIEAPNGTIINNATFADLITVLQLPGAALWNYTMTFANKTYNDINATLDVIICDGPQGATRKLLWPDALRPNWVDPAAREGWWSAYIIGGIGVLGIGYGGTHLGVIHEGITANISVETEVRILAATGFMEYVFLTMLFRLQSVERRWIGRGEALVLNAFIWVGAQLLKLLEVLTQACYPPASASAGISNVFARAGNQIQVITTGAGTTIAQSISSNYLLGLLGANEQAGSSSGDIENQFNTATAAVGQTAEVVQARAEGLAQAGAVALQMTNEAIQRQLSGGNPGETCG